MGRPKCSPERDTHCDKRKIGTLQNQRRTLGRGLRGRQYHPFEIIALLNFAPVFVFDFVGIRNIYSSQWVSLSGEHFGRPIKEIHPYSEVFKKPHFSGRPTKKKALYKESNRPYSPPLGGRAGRLFVRHPIPPPRLSHAQK